MTWLFVAAGVQLSAVLLYGWSGAAGMGLGLSSGLFGVFGLWLLIRLLEGSAGDGKAGGFGVALTLVAVGAKLPVFLVCGRIAQSIGSAAFNCFIAGIVLVYFSAVVWAAAAGPEATNSPNGSPAD